MTLLDIDTNSYDKNNYKLIKLNNGLEALIISDYAASVAENNNKENKSSYFSLVIEVGVNDSPAEIMGLAHFLEHMLYMGSEKYPGENDFASHINANGGFTNAYTAGEITNFYFSCSRRQFQKALDIFVNFLIAPLFKKDSVDRELQAVENEYNLGFGNHLILFNDILGIALKDDSSLKKFGAGNIKSLKTIPEQNNINVYERLRQFFEEHYSADKMHLAIYSFEPIEDIEEYVQNIFSKVPVRNTIVRDYSMYMEPFDPVKFNRYYFYDSGFTPWNFTLVWEIPQQLNYKTQTNLLLRYLFNSRSPNSLHDHLFQRNFVLYTGGNIIDYESSTNDLFMLNFMLAGDGYKNIEKVVEIVFSYIEFLKKGIPIDVVNDCAAINEVKFDNAQFEININSITKLASDQLLYSPEHLLSGPYKMFEYDEQHIMNLLGIFTSDRLFVGYGVFDQKIKFPFHTEWYDVTYQVFDIPTSHREAWSNPKPIDTFEFPPPNIFRPNSYEIFEIRPNERKLRPRNIVKSIRKKYGNLWFCRDDYYLLPKIFATFIFKTTCLMGTPSKMTNYEFWLKALFESLDSLHYDATQIDSGIAMSTEANCIILSVECYSNSYLPVLDKLLNQLSGLKLTDNIFNRIKFEMEGIYMENSTSTKIIFREIIEKLQFECNYMSKERLKLLNYIEKAYIEEYSKTVFTSLTVDSLFYGNIREKDASYALNKVVKSLKLTGWGKIEVDRMRYWTKQTVHIRLCNHCMLDEKLYLHIEYFIGPADNVSIMYNNLLSEILYEKCFNFLRTKESLGYVVELAPHNVANILSISIYLISDSSKYTLDHCREKIEYFFTVMTPKILKNMTEKLFKEYVQSCVEKLTAKPERMSTQNQIFLEPIYRQDYNFDYKLQWSKTVRSFTRESLYKWFDENYGKISRKDPDNCHKLILEVDTYYKKDNSVRPTNKDSYGCAYLQIDDNDTWSDTIDDIITDCPLYPPIILR